MGRRTNTAKWMENQSRWQINVQKDGRRRSFTSSTPGRTGQREANAKADAWLDDGISGAQRVSVLWAEYVADIDASTSLSNSSKVQSIGDNYILPAIGHLRIDRLTESHLQGILNQAYKSGSLKKERSQTWRYLAEGETLSRKTLSCILATIKSFIKYCRVMCKATLLNPETLKIPDGARYKGRNILQPEALAVLFREDQTTYKGKRIFDRWIHAYRFAVSVGTRPGETVGLWYGDVRDGVVQIRRSINVYGEETKGKNKNALRSIALPPLAQKAVCDQIAYLVESGVELHLNTPLFQISSEHAYYAAWKRYCTANDIGPVSLYELRHTFVSLAKHLPDGQVKAIVGHSRSMDTFGIYSHKITGDDQRLAEDLGKLFDKVLG